MVSSSSCHRGDIVHLQNCPRVWKVLCHPRRALVTPGGIGSHLLDRCDFAMYAPFRRRRVAAAQPGMPVNDLSSRTGESRLGQKSRIHPQFFLVPLTKFRRYTRFRFRETRSVGVIAEPIRLDHLIMRADHVGKLRLNDSRTVKHQWVSNETCSHPTYITSLMWGLGSPR